ncbi:MAG TPA: TIGR03435 family protein [Terracidiphilus sp.]|nr:TIGR03435 family protein [Terracidiphilus sp.]
MTHVLRRFSKSFVPGFIAVIALAAVWCFGVKASTQESPTSPQDIVGTWQGTLHTPGGDLRTVLKIAKNDKGALTVTLYSIDQGGQGIAATSASFQDQVLKYGIQFIDGSYEGKMSADGKSITGTWKQGDNSNPLLLERATPATAWAIPEPPPRVPPMPADAHPTFEVATIKPTKPDEQRKFFIVRGAEFLTVNTSLNDLIGFAYDVHSKQVIGGPAWMSEKKFDIEAKPDIAGAPNREQVLAMVQKLLADRFQLKFHKEKQELSAYVLTVGKAGPKMTRDTENPNGLPGLFFQKLGVLTVRNATMADFSHLMQSAVLDRPVVDQTSLDGKWDFVLKWTPDESQFGGMGIKVPPPTDAADAPPPLVTAIQEQIGLKLDAGKAPVDVLVLDHVEEPSAN